MDRNNEKNMKQNHQKLALITLLVVAMLACSSFLYAEESVPPSAGTESSVTNTLEKFDPNALHQALQGRVGHLKEKMEELKAQDPARYEAMMDSVREKRMGHLADLAEKNPERFQKIIERKNKKFGEIQQGNPEHHRQILDQKLKHRRQRLEHLKANQPEAFEKLQSAPGDTLRDRLRYIKQTDPQLAKHMHHLAQEHKKDRFEHKKDEFLGRWKNATPEERKEWAKNHPGIVEHIKERREDAGEKIRHATPEERKEWAKNHPGIVEHIKERREDAGEKIRHATPEERKQFRENHAGFAEKVGQRRSGGAFRRR